MDQKLYQNVIDYINAKIISEELMVGDFIPSESQLSKQLNVSVGTVRKAIDKLENSNILRRYHGKGTCVQSKLVANKNDYKKERTDLAAAFRWAARLNMHEAVANHFSLAVSDDGSKFLLNPIGMHFSQIRASDLILVDSNDESTMSKPNAPDPTAWAIHGALHRNNPQARCILHVHPKYATILSCLEDKTMKPIDQNTMRFYEKVSIDYEYSGMGLGEEAERLSTILGDNSVMLMGNHGVLTAAKTVAKAFDDLFYFERSCETLIGAYQTGKALHQVSHEIATKTAAQWQKYDASDMHFDALKRILDKEEADYKN